MTVRVGIIRNPDESWHDCAIRYAERSGLRFEVAKQFDTHIKEGMSEEQAAFSACWEWDVCGIMEGPEETTDGADVGVKSTDEKDTSMRSALRKIATNTTGSAKDLSMIAFDALIDNPDSGTPTSTDMMTVYLYRIEQMLTKQQIAIDNINRLFLSMVQAANENPSKNGPN